MVLQRFIIISSVGATSLRQGSRILKWSCGTKLAWTLPQLPRPLTLDVRSPYLSVWTNDCDDCWSCFFGCQFCWVSALIPGVKEPDILGCCGRMSTPLQSGCMWSWLMLLLAIHVYVKNSCCHHTWPKMITELRVLHFLAYGYHIAKWMRSHDKEYVLLDRSSMMTLVCEV